MAKKSGTKTSRLGSDPFNEKLPFIRDTRQDDGEEAQGKSSKQETESKADTEPVSAKTPSKPRKAPKPEAGKRPVGRPRGPSREIFSKSQLGLPDGWTRATFIFREDLLRRVKDYAYWERLEMKQVINTAVEAFLRGKHIRPRP